MHVECDQGNANAQALPNTLKGPPLCLSTFGVFGLSARLCIDGYIRRIRVSDKKPGDGKLCDLILESSYIGFLADFQHTSWTLTKFTDFKSFPDLPKPPKQA